MSRFAFAAMAAVVALAATPAFADFDSDIKACEGSPDTGVSWQDSIAGCTGAI